MREKKWTKGELIQHHEMKECVVLVPNNGQPENLFTQNSDGYFCCQSVHDAALLSAAQDLVNALEDAIGYIESNCVASGNVRASLDIALAKAYGEGEYS